MSRISAALGLLALALVLAAPAGAEVLPPGSYRDTCRDCYVDNGRLHCRCRGDGGGWYRTSIKYYRCGGDISNVDGSLSCGGGGRYSLPQGSWRESCRNGRVQGDTLLAECKNRHGDWVQAWLSLKRCRRQVGNEDGRLVCGGGRTYPMPGGAWRESCRNPVVSGGVLEAECRNRSGDWHGTRVDIRGCRALTNDNGRLRCVRR